MKKINVIDLDSTLIPYDSFGKLVKNEIKKFDLFVCFISIIRVLKMISSQKLKKLLTVHTGKKYDQSYLDNYANTIYKDIDNRVLNNVLSKTDKDTHNILISASPHLYVKRIIELLEWKGSGSYFEEGKFINLYSQEKVNWLSNNYPSSKFKYYFAISNCNSDDYLLNLFEKSIFWENQ